MQKERVATCISLDTEIKEMLDELSNQDLGNRKSSAWIANMVVFEFARRYPNDERLLNYNRLLKHGSSRKN